MLNPRPAEPAAFSTVQFAASELAFRQHLKRALVAASLQDELYRQLHRKTASCLV